MHFINFTCYLFVIFLQQQKETEKQKKLSQRKPNLLAKVGESDRSIKVKKPKHLFSSKMTNGKKDWR